MSTINTLDLIDAIANRELTPVRHGGHGGVACRIGRGSNMEGLPAAHRQVEQSGDGFMVSWPKHPWNHIVQQYVDLVFDESGAGAA